MTTKVQAFQICSSISLLLTDGDYKLGSQSILVVTMQRIKIQPGLDSMRAHHRTGDNQCGIYRTCMCTPIPPPGRFGSSLPLLVFLNALKVLNGDKKKIVSFKFCSLKYVTIIHFSKHVSRPSTMVYKQLNKEGRVKRKHDLFLPFLYGSSCH